MTLSEHRTAADERDGATSSGLSAPDVMTDETSRQLYALRSDIDRLLSSFSAAEEAWTPWSARVAANYRASARNLIHYWAMRQQDLRSLQTRLAEFGLSSLGRSEAHVEATLALVKAAIDAMLGAPWQPPTRPAVRIDEGNRLLRRRAVDLLGRAPTGRSTRIMVTLPSEAATDPALVLGLVQRGMNLARINCAHDDAQAWRAMAAHVRSAAEQTGQPCLVAMDLAGPKLRTGPLQPGPRVIKLRPQKNALGQTTAPAQAWLTSVEEPATPPWAGAPVVPVPRAWLDRRRAGDLLAVRDARGSKRHLMLRVAGENDSALRGFVIDAVKTTYLTTGTVLHVLGEQDPAEIGEIPPIEQSLVLRRGDIFELTRDCSPAPLATNGNSRIGCTLPEIFDYAVAGQKILLDDGMIGGRIESVSADRLLIRVERAADGGSKLRAAKGVNVPDTRLPIAALTEDDVAALATVVELADLVQMSFVQDPSDVVLLLDELGRLGAERLGVILKIETRQAFEHLPQLLLTAMRWPRLGVMIARGDLAVECGYERLAEVQEEILWLCEAAHLPVIWATQVLEQLAKTGSPTRAEISDAAMSTRAECAMLNKGPYINDALTALDNILRRMAEHHYKKTSLLRSLRSWRPDIPVGADGDALERAR
ncbi:pyruvate kinase [Mycobacterium sp. OTB74]|uniref:pyruvate kinase n=1 Tax=Mycobacterium sp. OTB74 TaxID=1853452 RepID=UPI002473A575|nr:pyruvate kinase [Mycobacterium sp. OTB74]MDH6247194.1 pyruvate kinase [Mycobacterium sp. OTB74]